MDERQGSFDSPATRSSIDQELDMVETAIEFVLAGGAARVTLAGLRYGRQIMSRPTNGRFAGRVRLEALWRFDGSGCDIAVMADG